MANLTRDNFLSSPINQEEEEKPTLSRDNFLSPPQKEITKDNFLSKTEDNGEWDRNKFYEDINLVKDSNVILFGTNAKDWSNDDHVENFIEYQRQFDVGNSATVVRTLSTINNLEDEDLTRLGEGYALWTASGSAFGKGGTLQDKADAFLDYAGGIAADPLTYVGLGVGKLVTSGGTKAASIAARQMAMKAARQAAGTKLTKNALATKVGQEAAEKTFATAMTQANKEAAKEIAGRTAQRMTLEGARKEAIKQVAATVAVDTAISVGAEAAYQKAYIETGVQNDISLSRVALAGLGTMILGGAQLGLSTRTGKAGWKPQGMAPNEGVQVKNVLKDINEGLAEKVLARTDWKEAVDAGRGLGGLDTVFWKDFMETMIPSLQKEGYVWVRQSKEDTVSNWLKDIIRTAEPEDAAEFLQGFSKVTGVQMTDLSKKGLDDFANHFAATMNSAASLMSKSSEVARKLGVKVEQVTYSDLLDDMLGGGVAQTGKVSKPIAAIQDFFGATGRLVSDVQNNTIRMIVSNLSTTRLNLVGYGMATTMNSVSDVALGAVYSLKGAGYKVLARGQASQEAFRTSRIMFAMQKQKAANLLDGNMTLDQFKELALNRPSQMRELMATLQGGIEDQNSLYARIGVQPGDSVVTNSMDKGVDLIARANGVIAQDIYTKSQEFMYQMDKAVRLKFNRPLAEVLGDKNLRAVMATEKWAEAEAKAVWETGRAIYSTSYRTAPGAMGDVARFIEDFRNIPIVGITIPFGRFYNNVLATTMDLSGLSLAGKVLSKNLQKNRTAGELATRMGVGWVAVSAVADMEDEWIDRGLGTFQYEDGTGTVVDMKYTFPGSLIKGTARLLAYRRRGEEPPSGVTEELTQLFNVGGTIRDTLIGGGEVPETVMTDIGEFAIGQLTRDLTDATSNILEVGMALLRGDEGVGAFDIIERPLVSVGSGMTRFLEPINIAKKLVDGTDMKILDPKDGRAWVNETFRYVDSFYTTSDVEKYDAASGSRGVQADKFISDRQDILTDTERVANLVGIPAWQLNKYTDSAEANNTYVKFFHSFIEDKASKLMADKKFREGDLEMKKFMWDKLVESARATTKSALQQGIQGTDPSVPLLFEILDGNPDKAALQEGMRRVAPNTNIEDMSAGELRVLKSFLDSRDLWLERQ